MEIKNAKLTGTFQSCTYALELDTAISPFYFSILWNWYKRYAVFQEYNLMYQLMNSVTCLHIKLRYDETNKLLYVSNENVFCMTFAEFLDIVDTYFTYDPDGYVLIYIDKNTDIPVRERAYDEIMKSSRVRFIYGVETTSSIKGKLCILQNTMEHHIRTQNDYENLTLDNDRINIIIQNTLYQQYYSALNVMSAFVATVCWTLSTVTAYLFWWYSFYGLVCVGTMALYVYNYIGFDNRQILRKQQTIVPRSHSIIMRYFYEHD